MLEVGDTLLVENFTGRYKYLITRVTKTLAMSKRSDGYEQAFKRAVTSDMSHPAIKHNSNKYTVVKGK